MKTIQDVLDILINEIREAETPTGQPIDNFSKENLVAAIDDEANHGYSAVRCTNCGLVQSALLVKDNCPLCGYWELDSNI